MININSVRKSILDNIKYMMSFYESLEDFASAPNDEAAESMAQLFVEAERNLNNLTAEMRNSVENMIKLAGEQDEVDLTVKPAKDGNGVVFD